ncbi:PHB depolymerase family esterase [Novosphingobium sp. PS1R-30]|uniref:PHB depolymerase family esterase n=1 Tax=Novosphingobium anseongense TaxID=3133436 RepID=A0ABU8RUE7_9SPHN
MLAPPPRKPARKKAAAKRSRNPQRAERVRRPAPGSLVDGQYKCPTGALAYKLYTPTGSARRRLPLLVMLHGCTQTAADFAAGTEMNRLADELGFLVLYPEQSISANMMRCWNWFRPENQRRGSGEAATIAGMTRETIARCKANPARVYIADISAGGSAAAIIAAAYPELYVAVGVHSAVAKGNTTGARAAFAATRGVAAGVDTARSRRPAPTILFQGDRDRAVHPSSAEGFVRSLTLSNPRLALDRTVHVPPGNARPYTRTIYAKGKAKPLLEAWMVHGAGHAWSGGSGRAPSTIPPDPILRAR